MGLTVVEQIKWENPPEPSPPTGGASVSEEWLAVARLLEDNPMQWARVAEAQKHSQAVALAHRINKGGNRAFQPASAFEGMARRNADDTGTVWARFVGDNVDPAKILAEGNELPTLKEMAKGFGLPVTGTKAMLAARIVEYEASLNELGLELTP